MSTITESKGSPEWRSFCQYSTLRPRGTNFDGFLLKLAKVTIQLWCSYYTLPLLPQRGKTKLQTQLFATWCVSINYLYLIIMIFKLSQSNQKIASRRVHCFVTILDGLPDRSPMYITIIPPIVNALAKIRPIVEESIGTLVV